MSCLWGGDAAHCSHDEPADECRRCAVSRRAFSLAVALVLVVGLYGWVVIKPAIERHEAKHAATWRLIHDATPSPIDRVRADLTQ